MSDDPTLDRLEQRLSAAECAYEIADAMVLSRTRAVINSRGLCQMDIDLLLEAGDGRSMAANECGRADEAIKQYKGSLAQFVSKQVGRCCELAGTEPTPPAPPPNRDINTHDIGGKA